MEILTTTKFERNLKQLAKKYPSILKDLQRFKDEITENPNLGVEISGGFRKIRLSITSKGKGKSGGARIITFNYLLDKDNGKIVLVTIYDKSERESISNVEIIEAFESL